MISQPPRHVGSVVSCYFLALLGAASLYILTVAPGSLWQDSGMAQVRTLERDLYGHLGLALAHPLYYVFTIAFQKLPFTESAYKTNLVSAVFGAITVANVFIIVTLMTGRIRGALVGGICLAVAHTFWQHCALAEVYTVTTALMTAELICIGQFLSTPRAIWIYLLFLLNGLGISNHMLASLCLACDLLFLGYFLYLKQVRWITAIGAAFCWLIGAALYLWLIGAQIRHGAPWRATIQSALVGNYASNVLNVLPSRRMLLNSLLYLGLNFPSPCAVLGLVGLTSIRRADSPSKRIWRIVLFAESVLYLVWAVRYKVPDQYTFFIPFIVLFAIWSGLGADLFLNRFGQRWLFPLMFAAALPAVIYVVLPRVAARFHLSLGLSREVPYRNQYEYFLWPWKRGYHGAERFAREAHDTLPSNGLLLCDTTTVEPILYAKLCGRWKEGGEVYPPLSAPGRPRPARDEQAVRRKLAGGLLYVVSPTRDYCPDWLLESCEFTPEGPIFQGRIKARATSAPNAAESVHPER